MLSRRIFDVSRKSLLTFSIEALPKQQHLRVNSYSAKAKQSKLSFEVKERAIEELNKKNIEHSNFDLESLISKVSSLPNSIQSSFINSIPSLIGPKFSVEDLYTVVCNPYAYRERGTLKTTVEILQCPIVKEMLGAGMSRSIIFSLLNYAREDLEKLVEIKGGPLAKFNNFEKFFRNHLLGDDERIATFIVLLNELKEPHRMEEMDHEQLSKLLSRQMRAFSKLESTNKEKQFKMVEKDDPQFWNKLYRRMYKVLIADLPKGEFVSEESHKARVDVESYLNNSHPHHIIMGILEGRKTNPLEYELLRSCYFTRSKDTVLNFSRAFNSISLNQVFKKKLGIEDSNSKEVDR